MSATSLSQLLYTHTDLARIPAAIEALGERVEASAERLSGDSDIDDEIVKQIRTAGVTCAWAPREVGGLGLPTSDAISWIERIAEADGSVGWVSAIYLTTALTLGYIDRSASTALASEYGERLVIAGSFHSGGVAQRRARGYQVRGEWSPVSGVVHADLVFLVAHVAEADGSRRSTIGFIVDRSETVVDRTWQAAGLARTGGHTVRLDTEFVPLDRVAVARERDRWPEDPLFQMPFRSVAAPVIGSVCLGLARRALALLRGPDGTFDVRPSMHCELGRSRAELDAARAYLYSAARLLDEARAGSQRSGLPVEISQQVNVRLASAHATLTGLEVVTRCYRLAGSRLATSNPTLSRLVNDANLLAKHSAIGPELFARVGAFMSGAPVPEFR